MPWAYALSLWICEFGKTPMKLLADVLRVRSFIGSGSDRDYLQMVKAVSGLAGGEL